MYLLKGAVPPLHLSTLRKECRDGTDQQNWRDWTLHFCCLLHFILIFPLVGPPVNRAPISRRLVYVGVSK